MVAVRRDIIVEQGSTFELAMRVKKNGAILDVSGYTGRLEIRDKPADEEGSTVLATATVSVVDGPGGLMMATISADVTRNFNWAVGVYDWKIQAPANGTTYRVAQGNAFLSKEVTRP